MAHNRQYWRGAVRVTNSNTEGEGDSEGDSEGMIGMQGWESEHLSAHERWCVSGYMGHGMIWWMLILGW